MASYSTLSLFRYFGVAIGALGTTAVAYGQDPSEGLQPAAAAPVAVVTAPTDGVIAYPTAFFSTFRPTSAFDMVSRVPGFTFAAGENVRGFGGAAGNVLIDGERPSSKNVTLDDVLKRIAPGSVDRLELVRGGAAGVDMQGQPTVVNVVRKRTVESTLSVDLYSRLANARPPSETIRVEGARRTSQTTLEGTLYSRIQPGEMEAGVGIFDRRTGAGSVISAGSLEARGVSRNYQANGAGEFRRAKDTFRLTAGVIRSESRRSETFDLRTVAGAPLLEKSSIANDGDTVEVGGDYQLRLSPAVTGRLVGLLTQEKNSQVSAQSGRGPSQVSARASDSGERIVRGTITFLSPGGLKVEAGGEAAFNFLDSENSLTTAGVAIVVPSSNVRVEERRGEGFVTASLKPAARVSVEAGARIETSTINQIGDVTREDGFTFVKPRLVVVVAPRSNSQVRFRLERTVGQLRFEDFAATSDLVSGLVTAGNANLEPERAWLSEISLEQRFWGRGALVVTVTHRAIEQVIDVIPVHSPSGVFSAPGNIGDGRRDEVKVSLTLPLDRLRAPGAQLRVNLSRRDSEVMDPTTGQRRQISLVRRIEGDISYTQDFPRWNSTFTLETGNFGVKDRSYRIAEVQTLVDQPVVKATWLYRPKPDLVLAIAVENLAGKERKRRREIYSGTRAGGVISAIEYRSAELGPYLSLRMRKTF